MTAISTGVHSIEISVQLLSGLENAWSSRDVGRCLTSSLLQILAEPGITTTIHTELVGFRIHLQSGHTDPLEPDAANRIY